MAILNKKLPLGLGLIKIRAFVVTCNIVTIFNKASEIWVNSNCWANQVIWPVLVTIIEVLGTSMDLCDSSLPLITSDHLHVFTSSFPSYFYSFGLQILILITNKSWHMNPWVYVIHKKSQKKTSPKPSLYSFYLLCNLMP